VIVFFSHCMFSFSFSCLIALSRTSRAMINENGETQYCFLSLILGRKHQSFAIKHNIYYGFFKDVIEVLSLSFFLLNVFNHERILYFVKCVLWVYWDDGFFSFILLIWYITFTDFCILISLTFLVVLNNSFYMLLDSIS
jgi:hypothetical protein